MDKPEMITIRGHHLPLIIDYLSIRDEKPNLWFYYLNLLLAQDGYSAEHSLANVSLFEDIYRRDDYSVRIVSGVLDSICQLSCKKQGPKCTSFLSMAYDDSFIIGLFERDRTYSAIEFKELASLTDSHIFPPLPPAK